MSKTTELTETTKIVGGYKIKTTTIECPHCKYKEGGYFATSNGLVTIFAAPLFRVIDTYRCEAILGASDRIVGAYIACNKCNHVFFIEAFFNRSE